MANEGEKSNGICAEKYGWDAQRKAKASTAHGFNGQVHVPLNLGPHHLPLPIPPSFLASMGYAQRNMAGMVPTNIPLIENPWGANMQFPRGVVPSHLTHYFPGKGLTSCRFTDAS
ncbi:hypothetical protein L484_021236 [Morus notabilis]|uniref:Uncharacterized protein n=1 Tax=Morus notabilis TaxID=981085 RepID=W9S142_9ROSA|nr:hypothetical protein L484_021236 [Morus notabilis]